MPNRNSFTLPLLAAVLGVLVWSGITPKDRLTWWLEVAPGLMALALLFTIRKRFRFTPLLEAFIALHIIILAVGGHYTYAEVPLGNWVREAFGLSRNHYDRLGHFAQGFVPAMLAREIVLRRGIITRAGWAAFFGLCVAMTVSASYELLEWISAVVYGSSAEAFLGTQGDVWDTQKDMACALFGAACAMILATGQQNRELHSSSTHEMQD